MKYWLLLLILSIFTGCESLEDTYSDYAEGGALRYLGKCRELNVQPGWKRLIVTWENHVDPVIDKIKLSWSLDGVGRDTLLPKGTTSCSITGLENGTYEIAVYSMDKDGNTSLPALEYMRPYTADHENVMSFTRLVDKYFFVKDRLALVFGEWSDKIETAALSYYSQGVQKNLLLDGDFIDEHKYYLLPDAIDPDSKVVVERSGRVEGCSDLIVFEPYELNRHRTYTPDFKELMRVKYGQRDVTEQFVATLETLEIDYNISTLEDILNMPALKTLSLAKNRYLHPSYLSTYKSDSKLNDVDISVFALEVATEVTGLKVERYNKHYFPRDEFDFVEEKGNPELPEITYLKPVGWEYTYVGEKDYENETDISVLFDEVSGGGWKSATSYDKAFRHEFIVDMLTLVTLKGIVVTQQEPRLSSQVNYIAQKIQVKTSIDGETWTDATYVVENTLGATKGETTILYFPSSREAKYIKFVVTDQGNASGTSFAVSLQKIRMF